MPLLPIIQPEHLDVVIIDGLPEGAVFCGSATGSVLAAHLTHQPPVEARLPVHASPPFISDVRIGLRRLVRLYREGWGAPAGEDDDRC